MHPVVGRVGPFLIYGYTVALAGSIAVGLLLTHALTRRFPHLALPGWIDGALAALAGALLGGRILFVAWEWAYFATRPSLIWQLWLGGYSYLGALLGGLLGLWLWCLPGKRPLRAYANLLTPAFVLAHAGGWYGCWLHGCAYGRITQYTGQWWRDWLAADLPDPYGLFELRYQTQLLGLAASLLTLLIVGGALRRWLVRVPASGLFPLALACLSLAHLLISLLRGDPAPQAGGLRLDTLLYALCAIVSMIQYRLDSSGLRIPRQTNQPGQPSNPEKP